MALSKAQGLAMIDNQEQKLKAAAARNEATDGDLAKATAMLDIARQNVSNRAQATIDPPGHSGINCTPVVTRDVRGLDRRVSAS